MLLHVIIFRIRSHCAIDVTVGLAKARPKRPGEYNYEVLNDDRIIYVNNDWERMNHPALDSNGKHNDLAMVVLHKMISRDLFEKNRVAIATLPTATTAITNPVVVSGFGTGQNVA